jgi:glucose/arabinose dehydrogenase
MIKTTLAFAFSAALAAGQAVPPKPAFAGQTGAPPPARPSPAFNVETVATGLAGAWALAFLPDGNLLVTQNAGTMRIVSPDGRVSAPVQGVPPVKSVAAQGLHDVLLDPDFARNRLLYFTYFAPPRGQGPGTWPIEHFYEEVWTKPLAERRTMELGHERLARARLSWDNKRLDDVEVLMEGAERRIVLAPDGTLFVTSADRFRFYDSELDGLEGKEYDTETPDIRRNFTGRVSRIHRDGSIPRGNPWLSRATVLADSFAHGLKDPEGAAIHPLTGELWITDHGPQGGDEINIIRPGRDYGWPEVTYGTQYDARQADGRKNVPVGKGITARAGVEQPVYYWFPSIAPSGMMFYTGDRFPEWKNNLFVGAMVGQYLARLVVNGERIVAEEKLLTNLQARIREVRQAPDGSIYVIAGSSIVRLTPR